MPPTHPADPRRPAPAPAPDPRVHVTLRLRSSSVARLDAIGAERDWTRTQTARTVLALGMAAWDRGER